MNRAQTEYINWLAKNDPFLLQVALARTTGKVVGPDTGLSGFTDSLKGGITSILNTVKKTDFKKLTDNIVNTAQTLATTKAQIKLLNAQTKRAIAGQPPIDMSYYSTNPTYNPYAPNAQYLVGTTAQQLQYRNSAGFDWKSIVPFAAIGLGAALLLKRSRGGGEYGYRRSR